MQPQSLPTSPRSFCVRGKCAGYEFDSSIQLGSHSMQHSDRGVTPPPPTMPIFNFCSMSAGLF